MRNQTFTWSIIQQFNGLVKCRLLDGSEIHAFAEELTQQAVGVLIGAAFPAMVRSGKITPHIQSTLQFLKTRKRRQNVLSRLTALKSHEAPLILERIISLKISEFHIDKLFLQIFYLYVPKH